MKDKWLLLLCGVLALTGLVLSWWSVASECAVRSGGSKGSDDGAAWTTTWTRWNNPDSRRLSWIGIGWRKFVVETCVQFFWLGAMLYSRNGWLLLYFGLWFPGVLAVEWSKAKLVVDVHCSSNDTVGNALSGHFFYFAWALCTCLKMWDSLPFRGSIVFSVLWCLFSWQGFLTWFYGYHSLRQCFFGACMGVLWCVFSWNAMNRVRAAFEERPKLASH